MLVRAKSDAFEERAVGLNLDPAPVVVGNFLRRIIWPILINSGTIEALACLTSTYIWRIL